MTSSTRWMVRSLLLVVVAGCAGANIARAEEGGPDTLEVRLFDVGALTRGHTNFIPERGPFAPSPDQVNDEERPLFGAEGEEPVKPYGSIEELIELVKRHASPRAWEREGFSLNAQGPDRIVVRATPPVLAEMEAALSRLERDALAVVVVDVLAAEGDARAISSPEGLPGALARGDLRLVGAARTSGVSGQRVTAFAGAYRAFVADYDVEVAEDSATPDPIVSVQPEGLSARIVPTIVGDFVHLDVAAWIARVDQTESRETKYGGFEVLQVTGLNASAPLLRVRPGEWALVPGGGQVVFAVRATVLPGLDRSPTPSFSMLGAAPAPTVGGPSSSASSARSWPIQALGTMRTHSRAPDLVITPSSWTPPEPPELAEPMPIFGHDSVVELVRTLLPAHVRDSDDVEIEARQGILYARLPERHAASVDPLLRGLLDRFGRAYRAEATVVSLPRSGYLHAVGDSARLAPGGSVRDALLAREGARIEGRAVVRMLGGGRAGTFEGRSRGYVSDYEVEIAQKAAIGNPVEQNALEGIALDVLGSPAGSGSALVCEVRYGRSSWRSQRAFPTPHGSIDLPDVAYQRVKGTCTVPLGGSHLLSLATEGDRLVAVLLSVTVE